MFKEKLIEIIPKAKKEISPVVNYLFWFACVLIVLLIGLFFFLQNQNSALEQKKANLEKKLIASEEQEKLNKEISLTAEKINIFSQLFKKHKISSNFFEFLRTYCHPKVQFLSLDLDTRIFKADLDGKTDDFQTLGEQILILSQSGFVNDVQISNISLDRKGKVDFGLSFNFSENIIHTIQ
ncbi:hypothetical protein KKA09_03395 [Patescibacteria group bacterium]|nr:hypothetical protein [Patescibacteria group bacterium]